MRSSWWQCLALAWTCWIQGIRRRVPQCRLSSRHTEKPPISNTTHKEKGHYGTVTAAVFLGILETINKSQHRWIAHSLPPLCCWYFIIRPRKKMILTLCSLTWFRTASVQQFKCLIWNPKCARRRNLLPSGVTVGINFQIRFSSRIACSAEETCGIMSLLQAYYLHLMLSLHNVKFAFNCSIWVWS